MYLLVQSGVTFDTWGVRSRGHAYIDYMQRIPDGTLVVLLTGNIYLTFLLPFFISYIYNTWSDWMRI